MKKEECSPFAIHLDNQSTPPLKLHKRVCCEMLKLYIYLPSCRVSFLLLSISPLLQAQAFWDSASRGQCQILPVTAEQHITAVSKSCSLLLPINASPAQPSLTPPQLHHRVLPALPHSSITAWLYGQCFLFTLQFSSGYGCCFVLFFKQAQLMEQ